MAYVDGFLLAVPTANKEAYRKQAADAAACFRKHGALAVYECWGEDVPDGAVNSMRSAVMLKPEETVVFSWILWPDKASRESGNARVMAEMEADGFAMADMPFDGKRMIFGGFEPLVEV